MQQVTHLGVFTKATADIINNNFAELSAGPNGTIHYLDPVNGYNASAVANDPKKAHSTIAHAYAAATSGKHDVIRLVGNGGTTGTARLDVALALSKSSTHLVGVCAPTLYSQRARIAPTSTTVGASTNKNYVTVSGSDNILANLSIWAGFATGLADTIALTVSGSRNVFKNVHIAGHADAVSAADAGSASLKITGSENLFEDCVIGTDTVLRSAANASIQFAGGAARNVFRRCIFPVWTSATTSLIWNVAAATGLDRETVFDDCLFLNILNITSAATMAAVGKTVANGINGYVIMKDCARAGITDWGTDATSLARILVMGPGTGGTAGDDIGRATESVAS